MPKSTLWPRRRPRQPSGLERAVGLILIVLLVVVVGLFFLSGTSAGPPTLPEVEPPPSLQATVEGPFPLRSPGGWPRGETDRYDEGTLFEKINGKAPAYLAYDFVELVFTSYADPDDPDLFVDVYLYRMGSPLDGFGIYRAQRSGRETAADLGEEGVVAGSAVFARKGRHYLEVTASSPACAEEAQGITRAVVERLEAPAEPVTPPSGFPAAGRTVVRFDRRSALGVEPLTDAFVALYEDGLRLVVARTASAEAASAALVEAADTFELFGEPATFETVGAHVIGVVGSGDAERVPQLLQGLREGLEGSE